MEMMRAETTRKMKAKARKTVTKPVRIKKINRITTRKRTMRIMVINTLIMVKGMMWMMVVVGVGMMVSRRRKYDVRMHQSC